MSASPIVALRKAVIARLSADAAFTAALGGAKIFDEAPRGADPPYVAFSDFQTRDWSQQLSRGAEHVFALTVYSSQRGLRQALDLAQAAIDLLDEAPLALEGHALIDLRFRDVEGKREQNGRFARVNLRFRALTENA